MDDFFYLHSVKIRYKIMHKNSPIGLNCLRVIMLELATNIIEEIIYMKAHLTLPTDLQGIVLSYVDGTDQNNNHDYSLKNGLEKSFEKGVKAGLAGGHLSAFGSPFITLRLLDESSKIKNPLVKVPVVLTTFGVGLGASIVGAGVSPVVGAVTGVTKGVVDFSIFGGKKAAQTIKNVITTDPAKKAVDDISYFIDSEKLLKKITRP